MSTLTSLVITKNGHDVAMVSSVSPAHVTDGSTNVQVSGSVSGNSGSGFIQLTITQPTVDQTGEFVCEASGLSAAGHVVTVSSTVEITNCEPSIADLVAYVTDLSKKNGDLNVKIGSLEVKNVDLQQNINALEAKDANLQQEVNDLKTENTGLKQTVSDLKNKTELMVYFNARVNGAPHYSPGQVVVFNSVVESRGNNYNSSNGLFTCTIPGYYHFTLGCLSVYGAKIDLVLFHNSQDIFYVYGAAGHSWQGGGNAATLQLARGDVVRIQTDEDSTLDSFYCSFHGYLIQPL